MEYKTCFLTLLVSMIGYVMALILSILLLSLWPIAIPFLIFIIWAVYIRLNMVYYIKINSDSTILFKSMLKSVNLLPSDLIYGTKKMNLLFHSIIFYKSGKLYFETPVNKSNFSTIQNFDKFIIFVKENNEKFIINKSYIFKD